MSALNFTILDLDVPAGAKNKTATLLTGDTQALLVDAASPAPTATAWPPRSWAPARP